MLVYTSSWLKEIPLNEEWHTALLYDGYPLIVKVATSLIKLDLPLIRILIRLFSIINTLK